MLGAPVFRTALFGPWSGNALWTAARAVPSLDLPFADSKSLVDAITGRQLVTFARAGSGTYTDSAKVLQTAATDVPRFDHNPLTGESLGLLVEEARTNILASSVYTANANGWTNGVIGGTGSIAAAALNSPAGTTAGVFNISGLNSSSYVGIFATSTSSSNARTGSVFVKNNGGVKFQIRLIFQTSGTFVSYGTEYNFNTSAFQDGIAGTTAPTSRSVTDVGGGWLRITITGSDNGTGNTQSSMQFWGTTTTADYNYLFWGAQIEQGASGAAASFPSSYIPATTAAATRNASLADLISSAIANNIRSFYVEFSSPAVGTRGAVSLNDNTANERIEIITSGTDPRLAVHDGGVEQANINGGTVTAGVKTRVAVRININDFAISINGSAAATDTSGTLPTVDRLMIGRTQAGEYLNGRIARFAGWTELLSDVTLQSLSQP